MLNDDAAGTGEGLEGLNFTDVLGKCLSVAVVVLDCQERLSALNATAEKLLGLQTSQGLRQSLEILPVSLREVIRQTFQAGKPQIREISIPAEGGHQREVHVSTWIVPEKGTSFGVVAVLHDITAAKNVEQHMRHLDCLASIGTLSASMAHEIKNALVAVKTFLELLIQQNKDAELAGIVSREMQRIDSIVSQMLRFAGPAKPTFSAIHLHDVLEHSLRLVEHQLAGRKIHLKKSLKTSADVVWGDTYQLEQAFLNLLFNASEAMAPNGELFIATELVTPAGPAGGEHSDTQIRLKIRDSGIGIPPENIPRLFDPFFTTKKKGNGLGLSITRRIIQEHGGTISVESALNQGTTFTILLPCTA